MDMPLSACGEEGGMPSRTTKDSITVLTRGAVTLPPETSAPKGSSITAKTANRGGFYRQEAHKAGNSSAAIDTCIGWLFWAVPVLPAMR